VCLQFLDAQRIQNLVAYLQELHALGLAHADHTTLLLNTYAKLGDVPRLDAFVRTESTRAGAAGALPFDLDTAIRVCSQAGFFAQAGFLARKYARHEDYLRIQVEEAEQFADALEYIRALAPEAVRTALLHCYHGALTCFCRRRAASGATAASSSTRSRTRRRSS
jgi:hypothetical protein